ncbi:hypothetical protein D3C85_1787510 [compost metagenome]
MDMGVHPGKLLGAREDPLAVDLDPGEDPFEGDRDVQSDGLDDSELYRSTERIVGQASHILD